MNPDVVGLGYCVYDILAITTGPPDFDSAASVPITNLVRDGGGQIGTALITLARLGARAGYLGVLGDDLEGHWLRDHFVHEGVDIARLRIRGDVGTGSSLILVDEATARRAILSHLPVRPEDLTIEEADRDYVQSASVLHLDGQFMPAAIQAAGWAQEAGVKVCYDGNRTRSGLDELLPRVHWLVVAEPFMTAHTGLSDADDAAAALLSLGPEIVVATQGERGCEVWTAHDHFRVPGYAVEAVDTTGAGDAFHGGFIYAMLQGWELPRVAAFANAVAALNCLELGGRRGLPTLDQALRLCEGP